MKKILFIISFCCAVLTVKSQNLTVEGTSPNLYITHTVAPRENFYSIGRLYNQAPKSIASFNNITMEKGLTIGQLVKIPLNEQNLDVNGNADAGGSLIPLTHIVTKSETITKIGAEHNVSAQFIKQWNNLSSDNIAPGTPLVVGHLKMQSTSGVAKATTNPSANTLSTSEKQEVVSEPKHVATESKKEEAFSPVGQAPAVEKKTTATVTQEPAKQDEVATTGTPVKEPSARETASKQETSKNEQAETPAKEDVIKEAPKKEPSPKAEETKKSDTYIANEMGSVEGFFASIYTTGSSKGSLNTKSGEAATFKSTSGWQDKKYYVLMNDVIPGTILKISSSENKVVYAKVLGSMPEMKENDGLLIRISNAAASYLGIIDPKFTVQISYFQ